MVKLKPALTDVRINLARLLAHQRQFDEALRHYQIALDEAPDDAALHRQTGLTHWSLGNLDAAAARFRAALAIDDTLDAVRLNLASVLTIQEAHDEALAHLMTVIEREPTSAAAHNGAAWILAAHVDEAKRDPARAVVLALTACELSASRNASVLATLVAACEAAGDAATAERVLNEALAAARARGDERLAERITEMLGPLKSAE